MKTMNISPLSLVLLLSFTSQQEIRAAQQGRGDDQRGMYPALESSDHSAYRSTGSIPIPHQAHYQPPASGGYPPSYSVDDRRGSEGRTPPSGHYFPDQGFSSSPHQMPPSPGYGFLPQHPVYAYPPAAQTYPPQAGAQWHQPAPAGHLASLPVPEEPQKRIHGHTRQRSNTFDFGNLSLETDTDHPIEVSSQLQYSAAGFFRERALVILTFQKFLKRTAEEAQANIQRFDAIKDNDIASAEDKLGALKKKVRSKDQNAQAALAQEREARMEMKKPFDARFDVLGGQCNVMTSALEEAIRKLAPEKQLK